MIKTKLRESVAKERNMMVDLFILRIKIAEQWDYYYSTSNGRYGRFGDEHQAMAMCETCANANKDAYQSMGYECELLPAERRHALMPTCIEHEKVQRLHEEVKKLKKKVNRMGRSCASCAAVSRFSCGWTVYECGSSNNYRHHMTKGE